MVLINLFGMINFEAKGLYFSISLEMVKLEGNIFELRK